VRKLRPAPEPVITPFEVLAFDVETNGVNVPDAQIISFALIRMTQHADGSITTVDLATGVVNPETCVPEEATRIHGITSATAALGMSAADAVSVMLHVIQASTAPVCAFNARFDLSVLAAEAQRAGVPHAALFGVPVVDPLVIDRQLDPRRPGGRKLARVCRHYGVSLVGAHDARADAVAAGGVFFRLLNKFPRLRSLVGDARALHAAQVGWAASQAAGLEAHLRRSDPGVVVDAGWPFARVVLEGEP